MLSLTPTELRLAAALAGAPGLPFTRDPIVHRVFGYGFDGIHCTVDMRVANRRRKIE